MSSRQKLAAMLAVWLILLQGFPALAVTAEGPQEPERTTIGQDGGTPLETPRPQDKPADALPEYGPSPTEEPNTPSDSDAEQKTEDDLTAQEPPENGGDLAEPSIPEDATEIIPPSEIQLPETPIIESEEQGAIPTFSIQLVKDSEHPGLYGTLSHIPENAMYIAVEYSFGGESYYFVEDGLWALDEDAPDASPLTQLCMKLDDRPYTVWQSGAVNSLYIRLSISCYDSDDIQTEPILFSNQMECPLPEAPPPFAAEIVYSHGGYQVNGHFEDFPPDVVHLRPMYSLDGQEYRAIEESYPNDWWLEQLGTEDEGERYYLENQCCITYDKAPLTDYVAGKLERFYVLLEITTEAGVYRTQPAVIERELMNPIPESTRVKAAFPFSMRPLDEWGNPLDVLYGQYQITVREGSTSEQVLPLLPDTLPVEVQLWPDNSHEMLTSGIVQVPVTWKTLSSTQLMAGRQIVLSDAVDALVIPSWTEVTTPLGSFLLDEPVTFGGNGQVHLVIDVVGKDEAPDVSLQENSYENSMVDIGALSLAFRLKPSGATAITAYAFVEGDEDWTELFDLLSRRDLDHNQAMGLYGFVTLLQPEDPPFSDFLKDGSSFLIGLKIVGGTFDGEMVILPWPGDYTPPAGIPEPGGSEGNENNAGSGGENGTDEGQRPDLPGPPETPENPEDIPAPPSTVPPSTEGSPQAPDQEMPSSPPETTAPEQPQTQSGDTEKPLAEPSGAEKAAAAKQPVTSQPPQSGSNIPAASIQEGQTADSTSTTQAPFPQPNDTAAPTPSTEANEGSTGQGPDDQSKRMNTSLPVAATMTVVLAGGGIAVSAGGSIASGTVSGNSFGSKLLRTLRNLLTRR